MRIVSLLPSLTELICDLGHREGLVGVTHECDFPPGVDALPHLTRSKIPTAATGADVGDDGAKLYLTPDVRFRLRMLAYQRGKKISAVANEVLDKALPKWTLERVE